MAQQLHALSKEISSVNCPFREHLLHFLYIYSSVFAFIISIFSRSPEIPVSRGDFPASFVTCNKNPFPFAVICCYCFLDLLVLLVYCGVSESVCVCLRRPVSVYVY